MGKVVKQFLVWAICVALTIGFLGYCSRDMNLTNTNTSSAVVVATKEPVKLPNILDWIKGR